MSALRLELFSPSEIEVISIIGEDDMFINEIANKFYKGKLKVIYPNNAISGFILSINKKCKFHGLYWFINGVGMGRAGRKVWIDKLPNSKKRKVKS